MSLFMIAFCVLLAMIAGRALYGILISVDTTSSPDDWWIGVSIFFGSIIVFLQNFGLDEGMIVLAVGTAGFTFVKRLALDLNP